MKFIKNLFSRGTDVVNATADTIVNVAESSNYYAQVIKTSAVDAALEASDELTTKYGGHNKLIERVNKHKEFMNLI